MFMGEWRAKRCKRRTAYYVRTDGFFSYSLANDEDLYALLLMDLSYVVALVDLILAFRGFSQPAERAPLVNNIPSISTASQPLIRTLSVSVRSSSPLPRADLWPDLVRRCDTVTSMSIS